MPNDLREEHWNYLLMLTKSFNPTDNTKVLRDSTGGKDQRGFGILKVEELGSGSATHSKVVFATYGHTHTRAMGMMAPSWLDLECL